MLCETETNNYFKKGVESIIMWTTMIVLIVPFNQKKSFLTKIKILFKLNSSSFGWKSI